MDAQLDAADLEAVAALQRSPGARAARSASARSACGRLVVGDRHTPPDSARREVAHQRPRAADVIRIAVRDGEVIERQQAARAERRPEDAIADVEVAARRHAARVDEQRAAVGKGHEHRVALTDVDHREVQPPVARRADAARRGAATIQTKSSVRRRRCGTRVARQAPRDRAIAIARAALRRVA